MTEYQPINCNLFDLLEEAATLKQKNVILFRGKRGLQIVNGQIVDLFTREKVEFLRMKNTSEIRLDTIVQFNDVDFTTGSAK